MLYPRVQCLPLRRPELSRLLSERKRGFVAGLCVRMQGFRVGRGMAMRLWRQRDPGLYFWWKLGLRLLPMRYELHLDHGVVWAFAAERRAVTFLEGIASAMGLSPNEGGSGKCIHFEVMPREPGKYFGPRLLRYVRSLPGREWKFREYHDVIFFEHPAIRETICEVGQMDSLPVRIHQMRRSLLPVYIDALLAGGLPVHGALVEIDGQGVILAGRSGEGKSTACGMLPAPWRVLADDLCLVVRDQFGNYRVHPLPTWSAFEQGSKTGMCQSGLSVPLRAIFFLKQAPVDEFLNLQKSNAAISLAGSALEVFRSIDFGFPRREEANVKKALYENAASIAVAVPSHLLRVSLKGRFWEKIEEVLGQVKQSGANICLETVRIKEANHGCDVRGPMPCGKIIF